MLRVAPYPGEVVDSCRSGDQATTVQHDRQRIDRDYVAGMPGKRNGKLPAATTNIQDAAACVEPEPCRQRVNLRTRVARAEPA